MADSGDELDIPADIASQQWASTLHPSDWLPTRDAVRLCWVNGVRTTAPQLQLHRHLAPLQARRVGLKSWLWLVGSILSDYLPHAHRTNDPDWCDRPANRRWQEELRRVEPAYLDHLAIARRESGASGPASPHAVVNHTARGAAGADAVDNWPFIRCRVPPATLAAIMGLEFALRLSRSACVGWLLAEGLTAGTADPPAPAAAAAPTPGLTRSRWLTIDLHQHQAEQLRRATTDTGWSPETIGQLALTEWLRAFALAPEAVKRAHGAVPPSLSILSAPAPATVGTEDTPLGMRGKARRY